MRGAETARLRGSAAVRARRACEDHSSRYGAVRNHVDQSEAAGGPVRAIRVQADRLVSFDLHLGDIVEPQFGGPMLHSQEMTQLISWT